MLASSGTGAAAESASRGLDVTHRVVAEIARKAAAKARQSGPRGSAIAMQEFADECERIAFVTLDDAAVVLDFDPASVRADAHLRRQADERIAPEAFASYDGLEQERIALVGELEIQRERRVEVRERLENERYAVIPLRGKRAKFGFGHDASTILSTTAAVLPGVACQRATPGAAHNGRHQRQSLPRATMPAGRGIVAVVSVEAHVQPSRIRSGSSSSEETIPSQSRLCTGRPSLYP